MSLLYKPNEEKNALVAKAKDFMVANTIKHFWASKVGAYWRGRLIEGGGWGAYYKKEDLGKHKSVYSRGGRGELIQ